jgi:ribose transport system substrate-binding protein
MKFVKSKSLISLVVFVLCLNMIVFSFSIFAANEKPTIVYIPKDTNSPYWLIVKSGADAAAEKYGAKVEMLGPSVPTDIATQVNIVNDQITRGVSAILLTAGDAKALASVTERAKKEGIPLITIDSGVTSDAPLSYIATDNVNAAKIAAEKLAELMDNKGEVVLMSFVAGSQTASEREKGFILGIKEFSDIDLVGTQYSLADASRAMNIMDNMLTAYPNLRGVFTGEEKTGAGVARQLELSGKAKDIKVVAFDASEQLIQALKNGTVDALIVQQPYQMGYQGVEFAMKVINGESIPKFVETPIVVVTRENFGNSEIQKVLYPGE